MFYCFVAVGTPASERDLFKEEFDTMTRIGHHPNVVNILGSCEHAGITMFLIYRALKIYNIENLQVQPPLLSVPGGTQVWFW